MKKPELPLSPDRPLEREPAAQVRSAGATPRTAAELAEDLARCSIASALSLLGEKWTILILRDVFDGVTRFDDFLARLQCSPAVLSARLKTLTEAGLLRKEGYKEPGARERFAYRPTRRAVELMPVLVGLMQWGDRYLSAECGGPVRVLRASTGQAVRAVLVDEDDSIVPPNDLRMERKPRR